MTDIQVETSRRVAATERPEIQVMFEDNERADIDVTIVLPVYNEAEHLVAEVDRIRAAMDASEYTYEIIIVDDGSTDGSGEVAEQIQGVRVMRFLQNRGSGS